MSESNYYLVEKKGHVAWVWFNRADKKNAMNQDAWMDSPAVFKALDEDPEVRAIVVAGKGDCFCAGIDLIGMVGTMPELMENEQKGGLKWKLLKKIYPLQETMSAMETCRKPVIAAIHGHCIGAGLDFVTACDIRLCSEDADFCLKETAIGFVADVGVLQRLPLIVGQGVTREMAYTAKTMDARRALAVNLVNGVYPDAATLFKEAQAMAETIAANPPIAVQASKEVLNHGTAQAVSEGLRYVASISSNIIPSHDLIEAFTAFAEKRKPVFTGN